MLAVVAAETRHAAREAAALVEVDYEVLEPVARRAGRARSRTPPRSTTPATCWRPREIKIGDVDAALANAAHVVRETFRTQSVEHAFLEPEACLAHARARP